ncbi:cytochrome P450 [Aspergillus ambiguus]|uniref:bifunctional cytochrome P450/NADPH--P450 reductase n=1 Tax=Aspergillus ambiguus TaxID=176160 RepID=UPI003CCE225F
MFVMNPSSTTYTHPDIPNPVDLWLMNPPDRIPIPTPKGIPILGNITEVNHEIPEYDFCRLADQYGMRIICILLYQASLKEVRNCVNDGLFTANYPGEENWEIAHRVLIPAFGPLMIRGMFDDMYDIASQLALKWARQGPNASVTVNEDFTRVSIDTVALCALGTRFNSFYKDEMPQFIATMRNLLQASAARAFRPSFMNKLPTTDNTKYWNDIAMLRQIALDLVDARLKDPVDKKDLLNALIFGRDPQTSQGLSNDSIVNNMITFLIAGHDTTSGMLSFLFYHLLKHPHAYRKAQDEIDRVIGRRKITVEDLIKLPYITAVMRETLRLTCPVSMIILHAHPTRNNEDPVTLGNGRYELKEDETVAIHISKIHRDPAVYGEDAEEFKPERMMDGKFEKLPKNAWKPFGNGLRGCIGRLFAWQEVVLLVAMLLQNFNFQMENPNYTLRLEQSITLKPDGFSFRAKLRNDLDATKLAAFLNSGADLTEETGGPGQGHKMKAAMGVYLKPMNIFFGSNMGTCEAFAWRLAADAVKYGFKAEVNPLDEARENLPPGDPVAFITASYEGQPPDNATHFFEWLKGLEGNRLEGVTYAVFGCGHHDWQATFHSVPKAINNLVLERGGTRLCNLATTDAANSDMFTDFDNWGESVFWPAVTSKFGTQMNENAAAVSGVQVQVRPGMRASALGLQLKEGQVLENKLLTASSMPEKRMLRFKLPEMSYQCGDYLAILPVNPPSIVRQAIRRFSLSWDSLLTVWNPTESASGSNTVPLDTPISAFELFSTHVELSQPASKRDLKHLADSANGDVVAQAKLRSLASDSTRFTEEIVQKRVSLLEILMRHPAIDLPLNAFLSMLPPMRLLHMTVRPSNAGFKPPISLETPIIMICAGSGLAPFRGFIMDRAEKIRGRGALEVAQGAQQANVGKAILYIGCRTKGLDDIHAEELEEWARLGAVDVRWVYSRPVSDFLTGISPHYGSDGANGGRRHVQDQIFEDREELLQLLEWGARIFVCGSTGVGQEVRQTLKQIYMQKHREDSRIHVDIDGEGSRQVTEDIDAAAESFLERLKTKERYATDVFT